MIGFLLATAYLASLVSTVIQPDTLLERLIIFVGVGATYWAASFNYVIYRERHNGIDRALRETP